MSNGSGLNIDECIETLKRGECISEMAVQIVCRLVAELLLEESNVQPVCSPVTIVGDLHGQVFDLLQLLNVGGWPPHNRYVFMGDFVDRGHHSVETVSLLLCLKARYPGHVTLLRGNHESRQITQVYGFYDECLRKFGNASVWRHTVTCFDSLGLCALIDSRVLCVHGGLSPDVRTLDQVRAIDRHQEIPHQGAFCDLVWSDPEDITQPWQVSPRGAGYLFGARVVDEFHSVNQLQLLARAHQLVMQGRQYHFDEQLVTVWSAPNYCYRCGNVAAMLEIGGNDDTNNNNTSGNSNDSAINDENSRDEQNQANPDDNSNAAASEKLVSAAASDDYEQQQQPMIAHGCIQEAPRIVRGIRQHFTFFRETPESMHGPQGETRAQLVPYFL